MLLLQLRLLFHLFFGLHAVVVARSLLLFWIVAVIFRYAPGKLARVTLALAPLSTLSRELKVIDAFSG
jgi:hypothetical protein